MKALIIAAGRGSRFLQEMREKPKPLLLVSGIPLIERIIGYVKRAGITEIIIVTGYLGHKIREHLGNGEKFGVSVEYIHNDEWGKKNGISVLKAKAGLLEPFFVLMSDHLFDYTIIEKMKKAPLGTEEVMLAVDYNLTSELVDLEDVTRVRTAGQQIEDIGKNITPFNAFDTGIFFCSPALFAALEEGMVNGDSSLTDGMKVLAKRKKAKVFEIENKYWIDVDTREYLEKAEKIIREHKLPF